MDVFEIQACIRGYKDIALLACMFKCSQTVISRPVPGQNRVIDGAVISNHSFQWATAKDNVMFFRFTDFYGQPSDGGFAALIGPLNTSDVLAGSCVTMLRHGVTVFVERAGVAI